MLRGGDGEAMAVSVSIQNLITTPDDFATARQFAHKD